jgi:hypothetical protein
MAANEFEWSAGKPIQTDDEYEWSAGKPFIVFSGEEEEEASINVILIGTVF